MQEFLHLPVFLYRLNSVTIYFSFPGKKHEQKGEILRYILLRKGGFQKLLPKESKYSRSITQVKKNQEVGGEDI